MCPPNRRSGWLFAAKKKPCAYATDLAGTHERLAPITVASDHTIFLICDNRRRNRRLSGGLPPCCGVIRKGRGMMRHTQMVLALVAFCAGLMAAWFWYRASKVVAIPLRVSRIDPGSPERSETGWVSGLLVAGNEAARLNKIASLWTAA